MSKLIDRTGERYGRLIVIERAPNFVCSSGRQLVMWRCKCDCGNITNVSTNSLRSGLTTSCGCWNYEQQKSSITKHRIHGDTNGEFRLLYEKWNKIKSRCYSECCHSYKNYGGRGIKMCDEWKNDYLSFKQWALSNGYDKHLSIDRIDVNGDYCPWNCRWVTNKQQQNNKRNNKYITFNNITHTQQEWAEITGLSRHTIASRLKLGWSIEKTLTTPSKRNNMKQKRELKKD